VVKVTYKLRSKTHRGGRHHRVVAFEKRKADWTGPVLLGTRFARFPGDADDPGAEKWVAHADVGLGRTTTVTGRACWWAYARRLLQGSA